MRQSYEAACLKAGTSPVTPSGAASFASFELAADAAGLAAQAPIAAVNRGKGVVSDDVLGLRLLCLYGLKGAAAYMEHARSRRNRRRGRR